jgi:tetratricopeptide (TPR) repeat protein
MLAAHEAWYDDGATVVAAVALGVSLVSSLISMWHTRSQDMQSAHLDLRAVLQRLLTVPRDGQEMKAKYKDDPLAYQIAYSTLQQELNVLASQGAKAVRLLGPERVSSPEYLTIGRAQMDAGDYETYKKFIGQACDRAITPRDRVFASCEKANFLFQEGHAPEGRKEFEGALACLQYYPPFTPGSEVKQSITDRYQFELQWARCEWSLAGNVQGTVDGIGRIYAVIHALPASTQRDAMIAGIADFASDVASGIFSTGNVQEGRAEFEAALALVAGLSDASVAATAGASMLLAWADVESTVKGNGAAVLAQLAKAREMVKNIPGTDIYNSVEAAIDSWTKAVAPAAAPVAAPAAGA